MDILVELLDASLLNVIIAIEFVTFVDSSLSTQREKREKNMYYSHRIIRSNFLFFSSNT